ncbi:hypothetical protein HDU98_001951, partial [Podochytrium sp. JEL0797]
MKLDSVFCLLLAALTTGLAQAACTQPRVRREWGELSTAEKSAYVAAVRALAQRPQSFQTSDPSTISAHDFTATH